jgi:hypothetical protein
MSQAMPFTSRCYGCSACCRGFIFPASATDQPARGRTLVVIPVPIRRATSGFCGTAFRVPTIGMGHVNPDATILKENYLSEHGCG